MADDRSSTSKDPARDYTQDSIEDQSEVDECVKILRPLLANLFIGIIALLWNVFFVKILPMRQLIGEMSDLQQQRHA